MELKLEDLVEGEIYYAEYDKNTWAVIKAFKKGFKNSSGCYFNSNNFSYYHSNSWSCKNNIRHATAKEKAWLNACIKANKFIPLSEIKEEPIDILSKLELW